MFVELVESRDAKMVDPLEVVHLAEVVIDGTTGGEENEVLIICNIKISFWPK